MPLAMAFWWRLSAIETKSAPDEIRLPFTVKNTPLSEWYYFVTMGLFGIVYLMLKKKMNPLLIMLVILLVSIAGAFFGVLGVQ